VILTGRCEEIALRKAETLRSRIGVTRIVAADFVDSGRKLLYQRANNLSADVLP